MFIVRENAMKDPNYKPMCMRCPGIVRMSRVNSLTTDLHWKCRCGAEHIEAMYERDRMLKFVQSKPELQQLWEATGQMDLALEAIFAARLIHESPNFDHQLFLAYVR